VVGVGALNLDLFYEVEDLGELGLEAGREVCCGPHGFEELYRRAKEKGRLVARSPGGSAANTIYALGRLGFSTGFVGKVGVDPEGDLVLEGMAGVDLSRVKREGRTGLCLVVLDSRRDRALVVEPNANDALLFEEIDLDYICRFRHLHMSSFVGEGPFKAQLRLVGELPEGVLLSLDPGELYARRGIEEVEPLLERSWAVFITEKELFDLTGRRSMDEGARELLRLGPRFVVCKRGAEGAVLFGREETVALSAREEVRVVDNTGAGDVFDAGFLAGVLRGLSPEGCLELAHKLAAKSLQGFGRQCYPTEEDLRLCA